MFCLYIEFIIIGVFLATCQNVVSKEYYAALGSSLNLTCPFKGNDVQWSYVNADWSIAVYSIGNKVNTETLPPELYSRLSVTGNNAIGEFNLQIQNIKQTDAGKYKCQNLGVPGNEDLQELFLKIQPSNVIIQNVTPTYRLLGTEGQNMTVSCLAVGGKPPPSVTLTIDGTTLATSIQSVTHTFTFMSRSNDGKTVTCQAYNEVNFNNPNSISAVIYLNLKPLQPTFSRDPVSTEETTPLVVSCTSTGSRPAATFNWLIGKDTITSGVITTSVYNTAADTYQVTSTLTYTVDRLQNGQTLICRAYNNGPTSGVVANTTLDVKFAPDINVINVTYIQNMTKRTVKCNPDGNPNNYTYNKWQHKSTYGELIRELDGEQNGVLTLPIVPVEAGYQDSGEYVCTASNGISWDGKIQQTGSGFVTINAQPVFLNSSNITKYGELGKDVEIQMYVYSVPKYTSWKLCASNNEIMPANKYTYSDLASVVHDKFHGTKVQLNGYKVTLTIKKLEEPDFNVIYTVELSNGVGQPVIFTILLESASPPETPKNFTAVNPSKSSILLQWEPGYNGGNEQTFFVEYRVGSNIWIKQKIPNSKQTGQQSYTLTGLQDGTSYEIRMYAENKFNTSLPTQTERIETIKDSPALLQNGHIIGIVIGCLTAVLFIIVIWIVIIKRKHDTSTPMKASRSRSDSEVPDGLQENVLYKSAGSDFKSLVPKVVSGKKLITSETEYAELQKPNAVYAEVNKTDKQKNVQDKKDKKKQPKKPGKKADKARNNYQDGEFANDGMSLKDMGEGDYANTEDKMGPPTNNKNPHGLAYADLAFTKQIPQKGGKLLIHGENDRTLYSEVDHTRKAPPPPQESAYEETNFKHG